MSYDPTGPYGPDPNYQQQPWQQPTEPQYGVPSPGPSYPPPQQQPGYPTSGAAGYPTSGGGAPPPPGYPQTGYLPTPPQGPKKNTALIITLVAVIAVVLCGGGIAVTAIVVSRNKPDASPTTGGPTPTTGGTTGTGPTTGSGGGGGGGVTNSGTIAFGADHGVKWDDKVEASVITVVRFTPSKNAAGTHAGQVGIKVTVKITNNSTKQLDVTLARVKVKSGSNGTQADTIIDLENNLGLGFEGSIAPNHAATADYAFSVPSGDLSKVDVEVSPDFDHDAGIFEGSVS